MRKVLVLFLIVCGQTAVAQLFDYNSRGIQRVKVEAHAFKVSDEPFVSFRVNEVLSTSAGSGQGFKIELQHPDKGSAKLPYQATFTFTNISSDTLTLENVVPFGEDPARVYITGLGDHRLSRSALFRPGYGPIGVVLPDNAWELGFGILQLDSTHAVAGLARRKSWEKAEKKRFETIVHPGGSVTYDLWFVPFSGEWQEGLRRLFQEHYLFDLETFDNTLFEREDLAWIRKSYAINLMMAWDKDFYNPRYGIYYLSKTLDKAQPLLGGWDVVGIWPTWPALGLDQRNQWDMFRDLPGGTAALSRITTEAQQRGTSIFLCYNPWDDGPRDDGPTDSTFASHMSDMTDMLKATGANGVVLDTRGSSSAEIQAAGDKAKAGVIMYSEGMAIPKDMPGIISGRVHNALVYPPLLNLNKFIKPDFAIFRVAELAYEPILREYNLSLFNGHGVEINQFQPGRPEWVDEQYRHLGNVLQVLRNNSNVFNYGKYTPLVPTLTDSVYVNKWEGREKTLYTIYNARPGGFNGQLFALPLTGDRHAVNLWAHEPIEVNQGNALVSLEAFDPRYLGTNNEGSVSVVAVFPKILKVSTVNDDLTIESPPGKLRIWTRNPSYDKQPLELEGGVHQLSLLKTFGWQGSRVIVQYFVDDDLRDEVVFEMKASEPRLISKTIRTPSNSIPAAMVVIPRGTYRYHADPREDEFLPYPKVAEKDTVMSPFAMDRHLVTNAGFYEFLAATCYIPNDDTNFLKHWEGGKPPKGQEDFPVVYIDIDDARAYAEWRGARLPTEMEWQYAAQAGDANNLWPWGAEMDSTRTSTGKGQAFAVGQFPTGTNSLGIHDLVGNVWQLTNDVYFNGTNEFGILKGGSYYYPTASWWYVKGGPRPLPWRQMLLRVSVGFERSATVGFRCVKDIE